MIFLGIDCGTQSTKTVALDWETGEILIASQQKYGFVPGLPEGNMEQNPADWLAAADATISEVLEGLGSRKGEVRGIGVSGQQHGLVVLDAGDRVIRPAKLWCDTSTIQQCEIITSHFGGRNGVVDLVGNSMRAGYTAPKVLWLKQNEPESWDRCRSILLPHDYLNFWLTGRKAMEYGDASGTALFDVKRRDWSIPMVEFIDSNLREMLPPLQNSAEAVGILSTFLREKWRLPENVVVSAGGGDNMMAAIGTGNIRAGSMTVSLGTSGTLFACADEPVVDEDGEVAAFCDRTGKWMPLVCTMNVTVATEKVRRLFGWDHRAMEAAIESVSAGSEGLTFLPFLTGERTPDLPDATGELRGLTLDNFSAAALARSTMEGVTLGLGYGLDRLRSLGISPQEIRLTGGGSNSSVWRRICADVFDCPTVCLSSGEGASFGAAIQAGWTALGNESLEEICSRLVTVEESSRVEPSTANVRLYSEKLAEWKRYAADLRGP